MAKPQLQKIIEIFEGVSSLENLPTELQLPAERELLKRISILRCFDKAVFKYLKEDLPESKENLSENRVTSYTKFVNNPHLERVPRSVDRYAIKEDARNQYLEQLMFERQTNSNVWKSETEVFQKLIDHYKNEGPEFDLDRLVLLTVINPEEVRNELEKLYAEADKRFDLARCNDLLRTFEMRLRLLSDDLKSFCDDKRQYYNARNLYITDFYQTTTYLERANIAESFAELLASPPANSKPWVFHVYATGGLGKTMFVRSLISRYCLPEPQRIPVARLDFDMLDLTYASRYPLLLLLPIANQLNHQIGRRPFTEFLSPMWQFKSLLDTVTGRAANVERVDLEKSFKSVESDWRKIALKEFCRTLKEVGFDKPIMICIDTFEEMLLLDKESLLKVIRQIEEMHEAYPPIRLILSGRYDLRKELTDLGRLFEKEAVHCELERFSGIETRVYLREKRGLKEAPFIEAIVEKCADEKGEINPFILALLTDLVTAKDIKTVDEIKRYPRAEVAYMIQRIIDRIKDFDVRWMLRYAVIPRTLTLEVLENILWPHLLAERQEQRGKDLVNEEKGFDQREYWPYGEASTAKEAWDKLKPFVSSYGWVSYEGGDPSRLRLHPEVVVPMRCLLAQEAIFPLLHNDACSYFARKAEAEPEQWAAWMSEAVYHRFQLEGPKGMRFWRQQLSAKQTQTDMEARRQLALEITKRDYVDEKRVPLKWPDEKAEAGIVTKKDLCEAYYEAAVASIMLAAKSKQKTEDYADEWKQARNHLLKLDDLLKSSPAPDFKPPFDIEAYTKLAAELNKMLIDYEVVIPLMENALNSTVGLFLPLALQFQLAEMYASVDSEKTESSFRRALEASRFLGIPFLMPLNIHFKLGRWYQDKKQFTEALAEYEAALARRELNKESAFSRQINYHRAEVNLEIGLYTSAARIVQELYETDKSKPRDACERLDHALLFGRILSQHLYRPLLVLNRVDELRQHADDAKNRAAVTELQGCVLSQLMEFKDAPIVLELAREQWGGVPDLLRADRVRMYRLELQLDQIGNVNEAAFLLETWETHGEDTELTTQMELLRVRSLYLQDEDDKARERWRSLSGRKDVTASARSLVRVLSTGLALGFGDDETLARLLEVLSKINPPSARLPLLGAFRFAARSTESKASENQYATLMTLIEWPPEKKEAFSSILTYADVLRFCDATERVGTLLERAIKRALDQKDLFVYIQLISVLNRSGLYSSPDADIYNSSFLQEYQSYRCLCYAALLEQAERELKIGNLAKCETTLTDAIENYGTGEMLTKWRAFAEELTGQLALRRGDSRKAAAHFIEASSIYERLGDKHSVRRVRKQAPGKKRVKFPEPSGRQEATYFIRLEASDDEIAVTTDGIARGNVRSRRFPRSDLSTQLTASLRDRSEIYNLMARITHDFTGFTHELGKILLATEEIEYLRKLAESEGLFDARLELAPLTAKIPWEWAAFEDEPLLSFFRYFYRSGPSDVRETEEIKWIHFAAGILSNAPLKLDGFLGPSIREALSAMGVPRKLTARQIYKHLTERLRERRTGGRVSVLIIKPSFETQVSTQRGSYAGSFSPKYIYDKLGYNSASLDISKPERLAQDLASASANFNPQLIHIESSFTQSPTTADVYLDFNVHSNSDNTSDDSSHSVSDYVQLSTTLLNDVLSRLPDSLLRPLVILEGQRAPSLSSTVSQVLLRNTFASELFRLGNTSGVVATGLFRYAEDRLNLIWPFIKQLSDGGTLGTAVNEINSKNIEVKKDLDLMSCPVLFTENPLFMLVPTQ